MYSNRNLLNHYNIPSDEGVWETDGNVGYLPKFIDATTMKFIESDGGKKIEFMILILKCRW